MIYPHPESDLSTNIMYLGYEIIVLLKKHKGFIFIDELMDNFLKLNKKLTPDIFYSSITFLYIFGIIEEKKYKVRLLNEKNKQLSFLID